MSRFWSYTYSFRLISGESRTAFLGQTVLLLRDFTHGLTQTFVFRISTADQGISGSQNTFSFGQLLALLLLLLPCFTVFELFSGKSCGRCKLPASRIELTEQCMQNNLILSLGSKFKAKQTRLPANGI